jgi:hypothetical protein
VGKIMDLSGSASWLFSRRVCIALYCLVVATSCSDNLSSAAAGASETVGNPTPPVGAGTLAIGTNLDGLAYWNPALPTIDLIKAASEWIPQNDSQYDTGEPISLDPGGWVKTLPDPAQGARSTRVNVNVLHDNPAAPTDARYVVLWSGRGTVRLAATGGASVVDEAAGRMVVTPAGNGGIYLQITATDPARNGEYISNLRIVREDLLPRFKAGETFNPAYIEKIGPFGTLRFMDWMNTNLMFDRTGRLITDEARQRRAETIDWAQRARPTDMRWGNGSRGVPVEAMVELANRTGADPWFNMPINASDDYVRSFATYVRDNLNRDRRVHVELSNEVWNFMFPQARYAETRAHRELGPDVKWMEWYGKRAAEVGMIWNKVFGEPVKRGANPGRVLIVYNTQFGWKGLEELGLETEHWRDAAGNHVRASDYFDEYAITAYYEGTMNTEASVATVTGWWRDADGGYARAIKALRDRITDFNAPYYSYHANEAGKRGLRLVTYESGFGEYTPISQHANQTYTDFLAKLQRRPEFYDLEMANYAAFKQAGGSLYMNFGIISTPSKWGNWSALESVTQKTSPRYRALTDWIANNPVSGTPSIAASKRPAMAR